MNEVIQNILTRRSIRKYSEEQVPDAKLDQILSAGCHAPCGSNAQSWHFLVIQKPALLIQLNELVKKAFVETEVDAGTYVSIRGGKEASKRSDYSFYYGAPTLVVVTNSATYPNAMADSACALENMQLAVHSLGLGSCWINQLTWFGEHADIRPVLESVGMPSGDMVCGALAVGTTDGAFPAMPLRKGDPIVYIR